VASPLHPREREPVPIVQEAGWTPGPVCTAAKNLSPTEISPPPGFDPRTVQPVASRFTDYAIPAHTYYAVLYYTILYCTGWYCTVLYV
jgi:hypothetical protein